MSEVLLYGPPTKNVAHPCAAYTNSCAQKGGQGKTEGEFATVEVGVMLEFNILSCINLKFCTIITLVELLSPNVLLLRSSRKEKYYAQIYAGLMREHNTCYVCFPLSGRHILS